MNILYENDEYLVIHEYGWGGDCEWEYYIGGYECGDQFEYAVLDKNDIDQETGAMLHSGHLCSEHIHAVWSLINNTHERVK